MGSRWGYSLEFFFLYMTMPRYNALKVARAWLFISDIHGQLDRLLSPMLHAGMIKRSSAASRHLEWDLPDKHALTCIVICGDITNRCKRSHGAIVGERGELRNEELLILLYIYHLNQTHPYLRNAITYVLGNHDVDNLHGFPEAHRFVSSKCLQLMQHQYENGRTGFFTSTRGYGAATKREIARNAVTRGIFPSPMPCFRDFLKVRVALHFQRDSREILVMHAGPGDFLKSSSEWARENMLILGQLPLSEWVRRMNVSMKRYLLSSSCINDPESLPNPRSFCITPEYSALRTLFVDPWLRKSTDVCDTLQVIRRPNVDMVVGHSTTHHAKMICGDKTLFAVDRSVKTVAFSLLMHYESTRDEEMLRSGPEHSVILCCKGTYRHACPRCKTTAVFSASDFLTL